MGRDKARHNSKEPRVVADGLFPNATLALVSKAEDSTVVVPSKAHKVAAVVALHQPVVETRERLKRLTKKKSNGKYRKHKPNFRVAVADVVNP